MTPAQCARKYIIHPPCGHMLFVDTCCPVDSYLYNQPPGQLSLAIPLWVGAMSTSPKGGDALQLESKGRYGSYVGGR